MRALLVVLPAAIAAVGVLPTSGLAATKRCPKHAGTLASQRLGRVWHQGTSLYACSTAGGAAPKTRRMGPWTPSTRVAFDGQEVTWTTRITRDGAQVDRVWTGDATTARRWLSGAQAVPATGDQPAGEARVLGLRTTGDAVAWVTDRSQLALASQEPSPDDPPRTLATPSVKLKPKDGRVLVGAWPDTPAAELASTLRLQVGEGEGDDCGGVDTFTTTVQPNGESAPAGAGWSSAYSTPCGG